MMNKLMWPGLLIVLVVSVVAVDITMLIVAMNDDSFALVDDYKSGGTNAPSRIQQETNRELGWDVTFEITRSAEGAALIELAIDDQSDQPLAGAHVTIKAFHKAFASKTLIVTLAEISPGVYGGSFPVERIGQWKLHLSIERNGDLYKDAFEHRFDEPERDSS